MRSYSKKRERKTGAAAGVRVLVVRRRPGTVSQGLIAAGGAVFRCALGRSGISAFKREGDFATPLARMPLIGGYVRGRAFQRRSALPLARIPGDLGWCDAVGDRNYNRPVRLPYRAGHETMLRTDGLYDACLVMEWNIVPRVQGRGSAIFFHLARPDFAPTAGCIAVTRPVMARLLPLLARGTVVRVVR